MVQLKLSETALKKKGRVIIIGKNPVDTVSDDIAGFILVRGYVMTLSGKAGIRENVMEEIIQIAKQNQVKKLILFGSRARGDYKERSDIDLAFSGGDSSRFILTVDEETSTLLKFDVIDLQKPIKKELRESIEREGIVIYEEVL